MYRNGFYVKLDELNEEFEDYDYSFDFLENEVSYSRITPDWFLHGNCDIFACYLHEKYGYEMKAVYEYDSEELIHAYCTAEVNNKTVYIDIRGITDDWNEFITEFDDWYSSDCPIETFEIPEYYYESKKKNDNIFMAAKAIEYENEDFYDIRCFY